MGIGQNIHDLRVEHKLTQKDLADKLYVTAQAVSRWEQGVVEPSIDTIKKIAEIFNVSTDQLLDNTPSNVEPEKEEVDQPVIEQPASVPVVETAPLKPIIATCHFCGMPIREGEVMHQYRQYHRGGGTYYPYCDNCFHRRERERIQRETAEKNSKIKKAWGWSIAISAICLTATVIATCCMKTPETVCGVLFGGIGFSLLMFTFLFCTIVDNNFTGNLFLGICEFGFVKMPGVIFSLDFDGLAFLVAVKILFFALGISLALGAAALGFVICAPLSLFVFPYAVKKSTESN